MRGAKQESNDSHGARDQASEGKGLGDAGARRRLPTEATGGELAGSAEAGSAEGRCRPQAAKADERTARRHPGQAVPVRYRRGLVAGGTSVSAQPGWDTDELERARPPQPSLADVPTVVLLAPQDAGPS